MITDTELDHRANDAAAEIRAATRHIPLHEPRPRRTRTRRPVALALAAALLITGGIVADRLADLHDTPAVTSTGAVELPYLLPTELPAGITLQRVDSPLTSNISYAVYAATRNWQQGAILAQAITTTTPIPITPDDNCRVRDTECSYAEYPVDNGATFRILTWQQAGASVSLQSATADRNALLAAATEITVDNGRITNRTLAGYPRAANGTGPTDARTVTDLTEVALTFTITTAPDGAPLDFLPGRPVDIQGHPGWLSHQPAGTDGHLAGVVTWQPAPGVYVSLYTRNFTDEQLVRIARSVAPTTQTVWDQLPKS